MSASRTIALRRRFASMREAVDSRLWPVPAVAVAAAVLAGVAVPIADRAVDAQLSGWLGGLLFDGGTDAARAVLSAIAGSLITAASLTFSLTVVALQLAASQGSPRLLRLFAADRVVHATLALFLGTFAFSLTVLRTVDDATEGAAAFVPRIAMTVASLLTFASVVMLVVFLGHLARQLRVETMMRDVHREASETMRRMADRIADPIAPPSRPDDIVIVTATDSGFITGVDRSRLLRVAADADIVVRERRAVGSDVVKGTPLVEWWPRSGDAATSRGDRADIGERIAACFESAYERTPPQDVGFGLRQLSDIAVKALSPGVNDPTTAVHVLGHLAALLGDLAEQDEEIRAYADEAGIARLIVTGDTFGEYLEVGVEQVRRYGRGDADVVVRLFELFDDVAWRARTAAHAAALRDQIVRLEEATAAEPFDAVERARFARLAARARTTVDRLRSGDGIRS